jgi:hypothetical protein
MVILRESAVPVIDVADRTNHGNQTAGGDGIQ